MQALMAFSGLIWLATMLAVLAIIALPIALWRIIATLVEIREEIHELRWAVERAQKPGKGPHEQQP